MTPSYVVREVAQPVRPTTARRYIPRTEEENPFGFAAFDWDLAVCVSKAGRPRKAHELDRDGVCIFCSEVVE